MLKKVLVAVAVVIVAFLVFVATRPSEYRVERSAMIAAPAEVVYAQLDDFHNWSAWSPWDKLDPNMVKTYEGAPRGLGASYSWKGNEEVGTGKMTVTDATPPTSISYRLEFIEPWQSVARNGFQLTPEGQSVKTTWWMTGQNDFMGKLFSLFMDFDAMIGADFEKGLGQLKAIAEAEQSKRNVVQAVEKRERAVEARGSAREQNEEATPTANAAPAPP